MKHLKNLKIQLAVALVCVTAAFVVTSLLLHDEPDEFTAELAMESDAMAIVNYYYPRPIRLHDSPLEANLKLPEFQTHPLFGALVLGTGPDSLISIILDQGGGQDPGSLYVDRNNNEDLTDDDEAAWDEVQKKSKIKEVLVDVTYGSDGTAQVAPYPVIFYSFPGRTPVALAAYRNGYRTGAIILQDTSYKVAVFDDELTGRFDDLSKGSMVIDVNLDGVLDGKSGSDEHFALTGDFSLNGQIYRVKSVSVAGDEIVVSETDTIASPRVALTADLQAPAFAARDTEGGMIDLASYSDKVVLIDFWATWCKPWTVELESLKRGYTKYNKRGFEIIGINLDYDLDEMKVYLAKHGIAWPQVADGNGWDTPLVELYGVDAIPRSYLVDRNGVVRYKNLRGRVLEAKIYELLNEAAAE